MKKRPIGRFISADPKVCHGKLTFRGTRILVSDVLELVAAGMDWDDIIMECHGSIARPAIAEAIRIAGRAIVEHEGQYIKGAGLGVIVLDENVFESQRLQLRSWRIHLCQIGHDVGRKGMQDDEIITLLRTLRHPSIISRDRDFFKKTLCNDYYCLAFLDVGPLEVAQYARDFLRHPDFKTWAQRQGAVARVAASGISVWRARAARLARYPWVN